MKSTILKAGTAIAFGMALMSTQPAISAEGMGEHKIVFQISSADPGTQTLVLNNASNIQKHYGPENVDVVVVAYGPGLSLLTKKNKQAVRVKSLAVQGITFDACNNTMKKIEKKTGKKPVLTDGVKVVPAGIAAIVELQEKGYSYIRP
jgi:intracellular sulfur oxidation DsrE/DsrF family protein